MFKKSDFLQRNAIYWKEKFFLFSECYTFWMKVSVCKTFTCQLGLLLERKDSCLIVFCGKVIHSVFTAFFKFGEKTESWDSLHVEDALTGTLVSAGFVSDQKLQIEDLRKTFSIQDWRLKVQKKLFQSSLLDWRSFFFLVFNLQSSIQEAELKKFFSEGVFSQPSIFNLQSRRPD